MKNYSTGVKLVLHSLFIQKWDVIRYLLLAAAVAFLSMIVPTSIGILTDGILSDRAFEAIFALGISIIFCVIAIMLINIVVNRINARIQLRTEYEVFCYIFKRIMQMPSGDEKEISHTLIGTFEYFISGISTFTGNIFYVLIYGIEYIFVVLLILIRNYDAFITLCVFLMTAVSIVIFTILLLRAGRQKAAERDKHSDYYNFSKELLDSMEAVKNTGSEEPMIQRAWDLYCGYMPLKLDAENSYQWISIILAALNGATLWIVFLLSPGSNSITCSEIAVLVSMLSLLIGYLSMLVPSVFNVITGSSQLRLATEVMARPIELYGDEGVKPELTGEIRLDKVSFAYSDSSSPVINDFTAEIKPGEYIGISGPSGCGKSTLIRLLLGFEKPGSGRISFDGTDIADCNVQALRRQFGVVLQDAALISGSIAANIGLCEDPDMEKVTAAAKKAGIYDEIMEMPMKFNTIVSSESQIISGGQRQRIVLARALMNDPKILILDEATSSLDNMTQKTVKENLDALGITRIVVAHRLSTIKDCDRIIVLNEGRIDSEGTYDELMAMDGLFAQMAGRNLQK